MDIEYKFETPKKDERQEEIRPNLHITRCCANCKFFKKRIKSSSHVGFCKQPNPSQKNPKNRLRQSTNYDDVEKTWLKAHDTLLCDLYQFRGRGLSIRPVEKWTEKEILNDGTIKEE